MSDDEKVWLELALLTIETMREGQPHTFKEDDRIGKLIAEAAHPVLYKRWRALQGRPGVSGAGEMVQAYIDSGMGKAAARKLVQKRTGPRTVSMACRGGSGQPLQPSSSVRRARI